MVVHVAGNAVLEFLEGIAPPHLYVGVVRVRVGEGDNECVNCAEECGAGDGRVLILYLWKLIAIVNEINCNGNVSGNCNF